MVRPLFTFCTLLILTQIAEARIWTSNKGIKLEADLHSADVKEVVLKLESGQLYKVPMRMLSAPDQKIAMNFIRYQQNRAPAKEPDHFENWKTAWPTRISSSRSPVIKELGTDDQGRFVYHSPRYEFISDAKLSRSVVSRFSILFEASREYVSALPLSMAFQALGFRHR